MKLGVLPFDEGNTNNKTQSQKLSINFAITLPIILSHPIKFNFQFDGLYRVFHFSFRRVHRALAYIYTNDSFVFPGSSQVGNCRYRRSEFIFLIKETKMLRVYRVGPINRSPISSNAILPEHFRVLF